MREFRLIIQPDEEEEDAAEVLVDGTIGGRPYRFLLDTGAARTTVILDDYTATFGSTETDHSSGVFARSSSDLITVPSLEVGPIAKENLTVVRMTDRTSPIKSLIAMDLLKDLRCHFLFDENRVLVDADDDPGTNYTFQDLLFDDRFHPYVDIQFASSKGTAAKAVWDTGASLTIVDTNFVQKHPEFFKEVGQSSGTDSTGTKVETPMFMMGATLIGGHEFPPHKVAGVDLSGVNSTLQIPMDFIVGYGTYRRAHWLFDFPGKRWTISKMLKV